MGIRTSPWKRKRVVKDAPPFVVTGLVRVGESGTMALAVSQGTEPISGDKTHHRPDGFHAPFHTGPLQGTSRDPGYRLKRMQYATDPHRSYVYALDLAKPVRQRFTVIGDDLLGYRYAR